MTMTAFWNVAPNLSLNLSLAAALINHLWQSTAVLVVAWLLTQTLRGNRASVRYWLWFAASMKFLIPLSLLVAAGEALRPSGATAIQAPALTAVFEDVAQPFSAAASSPLAVSATHGQPVSVLLLLAGALWACGFFAVSFRWLRYWRRIRAAARSASPQGFAAGVPVLATTSFQEPGVFGILRPLLLLPEGILDRLTPAQMNAIVAHELCHVRRRDNLTFALHTIVRALFWFHPLVWWIGARLIDERERACDEATLQAGNEAETYAEGILNVCKFFVESPAACVAGVSGSDLKKRIVRILSDGAARRLDLGRKLLLAAAGVAALAVPAALGLLHSSRLLAQAQDAPADLPKYAVASIKPTKTDAGRVMLMFKPDGVSMTGTPVQMMLRAAFGVEDDRLIDAPGWVKSDRFDIEAKVDPADAPKLSKLKRDQRMTMLQPLLAERFNLRFHHETRELSIYALVVAKGGSRLKETKPENPSEGGPQARHTTFITGPGDIEGNGSSMDNLAHSLSPMLSRTVLNKTGLTGLFDYTLHWTPDDAPLPSAGPDGGPGAGNPPPDAGGPSLFTAIQEQLGLKLESEKGPVDVIVIDHIEKPTAN